MLGGAEGEFGVKETADAQLPDLLAPVEPSLRRRVAPLMLTGLIVSAAVAAVALGPWLADMLRAGLARTNYAGREVAFPAGAPLVACSLIALAPLAVLDDRADLDLLDPELRRWIVYVLGVALLGLLDDALGRGHADDTDRGWRGHAAAVLAGRFSTGAIKAVGALALAAYAISGLGRQGIDYVADLALLLLATNLFNLLDLRPGRVEKVFVALLAGLCLGAWTGAAARAPRNLHRPGPGRRSLHAARAGDARRHGLEPGRGARRGRDAGHARRTRAAGSRWRWSPR